MKPSDEEEQQIIKTDDRPRPTRSRLLLGCAPAGGVRIGEKVMDEELLRLVERWHLVRRRAERTVEAYRYSLARLARFGLARVSDVTSQRVASYVFSRAESGVSPASIKAELAALYALLSFLVRYNRYPFEKLRRLRTLCPEVKKPRRLRARHLDRAGFECLRSGAQDDDARFLISVETLSGLRAGELARMRWEDLTLDSAPSLRVKIVPELGRFGTIKTGQERTVPICSELLAVLQARAASSGFLFRHGVRASLNVQATPQTLRRVLTIARERSGLEWVTFHALRHTRASWWVQAGVPLAKVAFWLGNSLDVCERYYAGLRDGYDPDCERMPAA